MSKPCEHCVKFLKYMDIKRVYYSNSNGELVCEKINNMVSTHITGVRRQGFHGI